MTSARISRVWGTILFLIILLFVSFPAHAKYSGGTGEPDDPYQIATAEDLMLLGESPEDYDKHFILTADIDLDPNLPGRKVFDRAVIAPTSSWGERIPFIGVFNGNSHSIRNLTVNGITYLGMFGILQSGAEVKDLGVVDVNITGKGSIAGLVGVNAGGQITDCHSCGLVIGGSEVGGLAGSNIRGGSITTSYSTGAVSGTGDWIGGLVGHNGMFAGTKGAPENIVANCYSACTVSGNGYVGGLVGGNTTLGCVIRCNSIGLVSGTGWGVGGLIGIGSSDTVTGCFWNTETSGQTTSAGGTGKTTVEMQTAGTFLEAGWDFVNETENGTEDIWWILEGQDYPRLWWEEESGENEIVINIDTDFEYVPQGWPLGLWPGQTPAVGLSADPYETLAKEPQYGAGQVLYGYIPLGNSNDPNFSFAIDTSSIDNWLLYVDINNNEDLTDDGPPRQNEGTGKFASVISLHVEVISASGETIVRPYELRLWITAWDSPVFYAVCHYKSEISIGAEQYTAIAYESMNHDALYHESGLWIDLNGDGKLDMNNSEEHFQDGAILSIEGKEYVLNLDYP